MTRATMMLAAVLATALACAGATAPAPAKVDDGYDLAVGLTDAMLKAFAPKQSQILADYIKFPSVAAMHEEHGEDTLACAQWLKANIENNLAMGDATLVDGGFRYPIVVGSTDGPGSTKPGVVIYGHYDVQPVDPVDEWTYPPFDMTLDSNLEGYGAVVTGRGAADNKGNSWAAISALSVMHIALTGGLKSLPINIILCIEGEEEIGSNGFPHFLENNKDIFENVEFVISTDVGSPYVDQGALMLSLRGMMAAQIDVRGADTDLHSGTYGGSILNPIVALTRIVSSLHDPETNKVTLAGYYDNVPELSADEKAELEATMGVDDAAESSRLGVGAMGGEVGYTTAERKTVRPTVEIVGLWGGFRDEGIKTVLPSEAHAKVSFRLAEGQVPDALYDSLLAHVAEVAPTLAPGTSVSVQRLNEGGPAYTADRDSVGMKVLAEVLEEMYGKPPTVWRNGGSINAVAAFKSVLGLDTVGMGFGAGDEFIHAPDERWRLRSLSLGQQAYARMMYKLARAYSDGKHTFRVNASKKGEEPSADMDAGTVHVDM